MADKFDIPNVTTDMFDVINDPEVDMIKVCTSHEVHLPIIEAAAAAGKHIFCEKPMALEEEEAYKIIKAVRKGGVKMCVDMNRRMAPSLIALREKWLAHKKAPKHQPWRYIEMDRDKLPEENDTELLMRIQDESSSYRLVHLDPLKGGGSVIGESVHWLDLACWFFAPATPVSITAWGSRRLSHGINIKFSSGDTATILFNCGGTFEFPKELYEVTHNGALMRNECFLENQYYGIPECETEYFQLQHDCLEDELGKCEGLNDFLARRLKHVQSSTNSKDGFNSLVFDKGHENMLDTFVDAIMNDKPSPCDEIAGLLAVYLSKLAIKSIHEGRAFSIPREVLSPVFI